MGWTTWVQDCRGENSVKTEVLGQRTCGQKIKVRHHVAGTGRNMRMRLQRVETHAEGRRQSRSKNSVSDKLKETDDGAKGSTWRSYDVTVAVWKDDRGMWKYQCECDYENVTCGQLLKSLKWRDGFSNESELKIDSDSKVWLGEKVKWQRYHGSVAALRRDTHGATIVRKPTP